MKRLLAIFTFLAQFFSLRAAKDQFLQKYRLIIRFSELPMKQTIPKTYRQIHQSLKQTSIHPKKRKMKITLSTSKALYTNSSGHTLAMKTMSVLI